MEQLRQRNCGLDVHQRIVVAFFMSGRGARVKRECRTFGTSRRQLEALRDWLISEGCTHVVMESTGVYWRPVYRVLEGHFELTVANAHHVKNVPGRKTDTKDSEWVCLLDRHGLVSKSLVPSRELESLRELLRYRRSVLAARTAERNRVLKLLESLNIKLSSVLSDVFGVSGWRILQALRDGVRDPEALAALADPSVRRRKLGLLIEALEAPLDEDGQFLLSQQMRTLEGLDRSVEELEERIKLRIKPYEEQIKLLDTIPGIDWILAATIVSEIGTDMTIFTTAARLAAWAGMCPGNNMTGGKRRRARARKGNVHLKTALTSAAVSASRSKDGGYLRDKYYRSKAKQGPQYAAVIVGHRILTAAFHILSKMQPYKDLGSDYLDQVAKTKTIANYKRRIERLGYHVTLQPIAA